MNIILFGPPGSGKGTQAKKISKKIGFTQLSTGDLVRAEIASQSSIGDEIKRVVSDGGLPSDEVIIKLVEGQFKPNHIGLIFDGFPRTINQAEMLADLLSAHQQKIDLVVALRIPDEEIKKRILGRYSCVDCGAIYNKYFKVPKEVNTCDQCQGKKFATRSDDNEEAIENRLANYYALTEPVLEFFRGRSKVVDLDGSKDANIVFSQIESLIAQNLENRNK